MENLTTNAWNFAIRNRKLSASEKREAQAPITGFKSYWQHEFQSQHLTAVIFGRRFMA
jgi:hypothetical protein